MGAMIGCGNLSTTFSTSVGMVWFVFVAVVFVVVAVGCVREAAGGV
jgi:hypothetical protein